MSIYYSTHFFRRLQKRFKKNRQLQKKFAAQVEVLQENPRHPSLRLHKLQGKRLDQFSFWIEGDLRVTFVYDGSDIIFTAVLAHDEY